MKIWTRFLLSTSCLVIVGILATQNLSSQADPDSFALQQSKKQQRKTKKQKPKAKKRAAGLSAAQIAGELDAEKISQRNGDYPRVAVTSGGAVWVVFIEWDGSGGDRVLLKRKPAGGDWGEAIVLDDGCFEHYRPAIAAQGNGVFVVWSGHNEKGFDLYQAKVSVSASGTITQVGQLTDAPHSDFNVRCASDRQGNVTVVWQSFRNGSSDIFARRLTAGGWGLERKISPSSANDWEPAVAIDSGGTAWISWDSYQHGNYDVFLRSFAEDGLGKVIAVTTEPDAQFHSTITVDPQDRVWVAWDDGGINWGKDKSRSSSAEGSNGLHYSRSIGIRVLEDGKIKKPDADLGKIMTGRMERYAELPHLAFDGQGTLWLVFRHWMLRKPHEIFHFYVTGLTKDGWTTPWKMGNSSGQNTQHAGMALGQDGKILVSYSSDGRGPDVRPNDPVHSLAYNTYLGSLPKSDAGGGVRLSTVSLPDPQVAPPRRPRHRFTVGEKTYTLLFGDCHRHTDIRGHSGVDGSALDTYRYALDAAQLDFLGMGDHNQVTGGAWPDGLRDYQWWTQQKYVDLFTHSPTFIGIYSYEHSLSRPSGHRNILYLKRGGPLRLASRDGGVKNPDNQPPSLWRWIETTALTQPGQKVVVVPHTFGSGPLADWNWMNPGFDCLLEIYQGCRGSYEAWRLPPGEKRGPTQTDDPGHFAQDALAKGNIYGFVSFSDHGSTHNSWAGIWAEQPTREAIFEAMHARRTFGASDEIVMKIGLEATGGAHAMGEKLTIPASSPPTITIDIQAPDRLLRVDVVKDGKYIYTQHPGANSFQGTFVDMNATPGQTYYYVRAFQRDPENPDGDPEIAWASPFFVTYE